MGVGGWGVRGGGEGRGVPVGESDFSDQCLAVFSFMLIAPNIQT